MANPTEKQSESRSCPTRVDGAATLFAHRLSTAQCKARQRKLYHKCFTCAFNHAHVAAHGLPEPVPEKAAGAGEQDEPKLYPLQPLQRIGKRPAKATVA